MLFLNYIVKTIYETKNQTNVAINQLFKAIYGIKIEQNKSIKKMFDKEMDGFFKMVEDEEEVLNMHSYNPK